MIDVIIVLHVFKRVLHVINKQKKIKYNKASFSDSYECIKVIYID